jgi:benzoate-CoA ligase family protein
MPGTQDHTFRISGSKPQDITFSPVFNVAVPHIDRHIDDGRGAKAAILTPDGPVTYAQLAENVNRAGNALAALGLEPGDRVLMVIKDCPDFFYVFWGAIKAGFMPVPLNTLLRASDYEYMITDSGCAVVVYSQEYASEVSPAVDAVLPPGAVAMTTDDFANKMASASPDLAPMPASADDDCFFMYSSGSTGKPKGAVHRHGDVVYACVYHAWNNLGIGEQDITFSAARLFFAYGLIYASSAPLLSGATSVLVPDRPTPESVFDVIERFKPTLYFGVPTLYAAQLRLLEQREVDLSSVRTFFSAGEALPPEVFRRWKEKTGLAILDGIGSTEVMSIYISNRIDDIKLGATGKAVPGYELQVRDENGEPVAPGQSGTLWARGKSIAKYYWNDPEKTAAAIQDGWLNSGDVYTIDADGYCVCGGRADDMMKVGGIWCSPVEIEAKLMEHPKVLEAAVVARPDSDELLKPAAYVVLKNAEDVNDGLEQELRAKCKNDLAPYKYPRWFDFVPDLPKTATGKIQRFKLRRSFGRELAS